MWIDDLKARAEQSLSNATNSIANYLDSRVADAVVVKGQGQKGNLSALEIAQGARGGQAPLADAKAPMSELANAIQASGFSAQSVMSIAPFLIAAGALFLVFRKKGRS